MEELKIVLTRDEAGFVRDIIWSRIKDNREMADHYPDGRTPRWIIDENIVLSRLYNKITAAFYESK